MFRLLQRMDETAPRHAEGGSSASLRVLKPVTVLADADESEVEALETWARGLDWVHWLFSSVRQRLEHLHLEPLPASSADHGWRAFAGGPAVDLSMHLILAWQAAEDGNLETLRKLDQVFAKTWTSQKAELSARAGELLLRSTRGARYQGVLGRFREACGEGNTPGHFLTVWAAVGHFFQLSVANVLAEYLRLEWTMATRDFPQAKDPPETLSIAAITSRLLRTTSGGLKLIREDEPTDTDRAEATPS